MNKKEVIPIIFSVDDNYVPFLNVAIYSLIENASDKYNYKIEILNDGVLDENETRIKKLERDNVKIEFVNVTQKVKGINEELSLRLRDYYSNSIYYRLFIPSLFTDYEKAIYLDADVVLIDDISKMYLENLEDNLVGAINDEVIMGDEIFRKYSDIVLGINAEKYFNSGVLLMNLTQFRKEKIEEKFLHLINKYNFETIAPDQDYLNVLCKDKVKYLSKGWDKMPNDNKLKDEDLHLIHFNMFQKPWYYEGVPYEEYFWKYLSKTDSYNEVFSMKEIYTEKDRENDKMASENLLKYSERISNLEENKFKDIVTKDYFTNIQFK